MARPYLNIGQITYATASNVVTIPISAFRVRGTVSPEPGSDDPQITITGFSQSLGPIDLDDNGAYMAEDGVSPKNFTFSADLETSTASTSDTTTYVAPYVDCYISGTAVDGDEFQLLTELGFPGPGLRILNIGNTYSAADLINEVLLATFSTALGFTASSPSPGVLRVSAPWGAYYNGLNIGNDGSGSLVVGTFGSLTASFAADGSVVTVAEFTGGVTQYNLSLNAPDYFGFSDDDTFSFTVGSTQSGEI